MGNNFKKRHNPPRWYWVAFAVITLTGLAALIFVFSTEGLTGRARSLWGDLIFFVYIALAGHLLFLDAWLGKRCKRPRAAIAFELISGLAEIALILYVIARIRAQE